MRIFHRKEVKKLVCPATKICVVSCDIDYNLSSLTQGSPQRRKDKIIFLFTLVLLIRRYNETFVCCRYLTLFVVTGKCLLLKAVFDVRSTGDVMMLINDSKYHQKVSTLVPFIRNWLQCLCQGRLSLSLLCYSTPITAPLVVREIP